MKAKSEAKIKREGIHCVSTTCAADLHESAIGTQDSNCFLTSIFDFRVCFACYPPESFKIICLTCIWLKFVDTSFDSSQKKPQIPDKNIARRGAIFSDFEHRLPKLSTQPRPQGLLAFQYGKREDPGDEVAGCSVHEGGRDSYKQFFTKACMGRKRFFLKKKKKCYVF